jgi:phosphate butyryltransferase
MKTIKTVKRLKDLLEMVKADTTPRLAVAAGQDPDTMSAIAKAVKEDVVKAILVGDEKAIQKILRDKDLDASLFEIVHAENEVDAAEEAVRMVRAKEADMLMKGLVKTAGYMKAILAKETGLLPKDGLLSHVALMEIPAYPRLLIVSDAAIIPEPVMDEKIKILEFAIEVAHALGNKMPKAALVSATETISFKVQSSVDAAVITKMSQRKQIRGAIIDGPLALDVSLSKEHCKIKELESPINGEADILIFPNIETANTFYKCSTLLAKGMAAGMVVGTNAPVILTSRADSDDTKFYSIVLAARMAAKRFFESED